MCLHAHTLAEELCCSLSLLVNSPIARCSCLEAQGWGLIAVSGSVGGGKLWHCTPEAQDRAWVVEGCKTGANYASLKLIL